jgi:hypothetical protein
MLAAVINLATDAKPVSIRANYSLTRREMAVALKIVATNNDLFIREWEKIHARS